METPSIQDMNNRQAGNEEVITQWQEPNVGLQPSSLPVPYIIAGASILTLALIGLGYWKKDLTYYLAAGVTVAAGLTLIVQNRTPKHQLEIVLTNYRLQVGSKIYSLADLAGFWLEEHNGSLLINVEPKKGSMLPISFLFPNLSKDEARSALLNVLAEVEPRQKNITDSLNQFIRL